MSSFAQATEATFPDLTLQGDELVIADFYTPACVSCRKLEAMLTALQKGLQAQVRVIKVNAEETPNLVTKYEIRGVPTMLLFKGGNLLDRKSGFLPARSLREWVNPHLDGRSSA